MADRIDLTPAAERFRAVVADLPTDALDGWTPCDGWTVEALIDHCLVWSIGLRLAAEKAPAMPRDTELPTVAVLTDWRTTLDAQVVALAEAWRAPEAWTGTTVAGTLKLPAPIMGRSVLAELIVHGWDLATATGLPYPEDLAPVDELAPLFAGSRNRRPGATWQPYGAEITSTDTTTPFDRLIASSGRDPRWTAPARR